MGTIWGLGQYFYPVKGLIVLLPELLGDVQIYLFRYPAVRVPEPQRYRVKACPALEHQGRVRMAEAVKGQRTAQNALGVLTKVFVEAVILQRPAVKVGEKQIRPKSAGKGHTRHVSVYLPAQGQKLILDIDVTI